MRPTHILILTLPLILRCFAVRCVSRDGELVLQENGEDISAGPFSCIRARTTEKKTVVTPIQETSEGTKCAVSHSSGTSSVRYTRSEMKTGTYCKYKCVADSGYKCRYAHMRERCSCMPIGARVVTVAVVGHGPDKLGETCDDKFEGYEFADAVACTRVKGEFRVDGLVEIESGKCERKVRRVSQTRFMRTERAGRNVGGCVYVCKKGGLKCEGGGVGIGKKCKCEKRGLRKVLIGLEEGEMGRVEQSVCNGGDCGPCGECVKGECKLKKDASKGENCECGEICAEVDRRKGNRGGKIYCQANWKLGGCSAGKKWMKEEGETDGSGRRVPDKCYEGKIDAADRCGCAKGYERVLGKDGTERCEESGKSGKSSKSSESSEKLRQKE